MAYRNYSAATGHIVDALGNGDFLTIGAALTASSAGQTIFIRPGTYTENPTLVPGVNLTAFTGDSQTPNVIINGNCTLSGAGTVSISNIQLSTNSSNIVTVSGGSSILNILNCRFNITNNNGIAVSAGNLNIYNSSGTNSSASVKYFATTGGSVNVFNSDFTATGTTTSTFTQTTVAFYNSLFQEGITTGTTSAGSFNAFNSTFGMITSGVIALTIGNAGAVNSCFNCQMLTTNVAAISVSTGTVLSVDDCSVQADGATTAISGAGTINYSGLSFPNGGTQRNITTSTQVGGAIFGITANVAGTAQNPSAGFLGEQIRSAVTSVNVTTSATPQNMTSVSLTPGVWDISIVGSCAATGTASAFKIGISTSAGTFTGNEGDQTLTQTSTGVTNLSSSIPAFRSVITTTTIYNFVAQVNFSGGSTAFNGRISATRVG
jgi:hypothetical protein